MPLIRHGMSIALLALLLITSKFSAAELANYTLCAAQDETCSFSGNRYVAFGRDGLFEYVEATGSIACTAEAFSVITAVSDNACYISPEANGPTGYAFCSAEDDSCGFSGTRVIAFGANDTFDYIAKSDEVTCDATNLGGDPAPDTVKSCYFKLTPNVDNEDISATDAAAAMGRGFNLGQQFENTQHAPTLAEAKAKIDAYYAKGFRSIRIPVTWTEEVYDGTTLVTDPTIGNVDLSHSRLDEIKQTIDYALSLSEMYVVLNAHHERQLKHNTRDWVLERLWQDISVIFANRSHRLMYEILNEPHLEDDSKSAMEPEDLRNMVGKAYAKIRALDPKRIIIIGGNQWFKASEMQTTWPNLDDVGGGDDQYLMATFHHYDPWSFCGDNQGDYQDTWSSADIIEPMDEINSWANTVGGGMPVYIGEWGVGWGSRYTTLTCNNVRKWYSMFYNDIAVHKGMPSSVWDDGGWFKMWDFDTDSFDNNLADCIVDGSCNWDDGGQYNSGCD